MTQRGTGWTVAVLAAAGLLGIHTPAALAEGMKIGALMPMTGGLQAYGETSVNGMKMAAEQANAAGGVLGGTVTIVVGDTQTRAQPSIDAAKRLITEEGVSAIVGALSSGNSGPVATAVTSVDGVPQISSASTAPSLSTIDDKDFFFRTVPSDAFQGIALAEVVNGYAVERVASIYVNNDYGRGLNDAFKQSFTAKFVGTVTGSAAYEPNKSSYRYELQKLAEGNPQALLVIAYPDDGGILIVKQALEDGLFDKFIFTDGMKAEKVIEQIGAQNLDGAYGTAPKAEQTDAGARWEAAYEAKFGELPPRPFIDSAYDATMLLMLAAEQAGSTDGTKLRDALRSVASAPGEPILPGQFEKAKKLLAEGKDIDYVGAAGPHEFDTQGDVSGTFEHWRIDDGKLVTVEVFTPE